MSSILYTGHSNRMLSASVFNYCQYVNTGDNCKYCALVSGCPGKSNFVGGFECVWDSEFPDLEDAVKSSVKGFEWLLETPPTEYYLELA